MRLVAHRVDSGMPNWVSRDLEGCGAHLVISGFHLMGPVRGESRANPFPRHSFFESDGNVASKTGMIDFKDWFPHGVGAHPPWGAQDSPAVVAAVESALERE